MIKIRTKLLAAFLLSIAFLALGSADAVLFTSKREEALAVISFFFILGGAIIFKASSDIDNSVGELVKTAKQISRGNLKQRAKIKSEDEIGYLTRTFNEILDNFEKSKKKLEEEHEGLKAVISSMGEGLLVLDRDLNIILINKTAERLLEVPLDKVAGKSVRELLTILKDGQKVPFEDYPAKRMLRTGKAVTVTMKDKLFYKSASGRLFPVELVTAPFMRSGIAGAIVVFRDVTEMKQIEEEREFARINLENVLKSVYIERNAVGEQKNKLEAILNSIGDAVFAIDKEKKIIIFNPAAEEITGFKFKEIKGTLYDRYLKFKDEVTGEAKTKNIDAALEGKSVTTSNHTVLEIKEKKLITVEESVTPIKNRVGEIIGCIVVFRDITARWKLEIMRSGFISIISHQLRTPLSAIKWFLEILTNGDVGAIKPKQKDVLKEIYANNESMINLVNTMLNMSRLESKKFVVNWEWINLDGTIKKILREIKLLLDKKKQNFEYNGWEDKKLKINTDKVLLKNIISNLLINASRYTASGGDISMGITRKDKNHLLFKIKDNGIGIPKDEYHKIFKKFSRASNATEYEASGSGLGLYIAKSILDALGGRIWFTSRQNKGTTFFFALPIGAPRYKMNKASESSDEN